METFCLTFIFQRLVRNEISAVSFKALDAFFFVCKKRSISKAIEPMMIIYERKKC